MDSLYYVETRNDEIQWFDDKRSRTSHFTISCYFRMTPACLALFYYGVNFC